MKLEAIFFSALMQLGVPADLPVETSRHDLNAQKVHAYTICNFRNDVVQNCSVEWNRENIGDRYVTAKHEACHIAIWYEHGRGLDPHGPEFEACMQREVTFDD